MCFQIQFKGARIHLLLHVTRQSFADRTAMCIHSPVEK